MAMSKDRIKFLQRVGGSEHHRLAPIFQQCFGTPMPAKGGPHPKFNTVTDGFVTVICRPSQFARFIVLRCKAGLQNQIKEMDAEIIESPPVPTTIDVSLNPR